MTLNEMIKLFLSSRKRGTTGARRKCVPTTLRIYSSNLNVFVLYMAEKQGISAFGNLKRVALYDFYDFLDEKVKAGEWSRATVLQIYRSLRAFFRWVNKDEDCHDLELKDLTRWLPSIEKTPRRTDMPQNNDIRRCKAAFDTGNPIHHRNYVATCLLLTNGIRIGELCSLTIDCTRFEDKTLIVNGKTGVRLVPITTEMAGLLKGWLKRRESWTHASSPYVFISKRGDKMSQEAFSHMYLKHRKKYNLPRITAHSFRHAFCTHYLKGGGDIEKLRNITGHSSLDQLKDYLHLAQVGGKHAHEELERVNLLKDV